MSISTFLNANLAFLGIMFLLLALYFKKARNSKFIIALVLGIISLVMGLSGAMSP